MNDSRRSQLKQWLIAQFSDENLSLIALGGDAGFRRYFRFFINQQSYIAVDSPTDKCNNAAFISIQQKLKQGGVLVPSIIEHDEQHGFFCLSDLGDVLLADLLTEENMSDYYRQALAILPKISSVPTTALSQYDQAFVQMELDIFEQWLVNQHLGIALSNEEQQQLQTCFDLLIANALEQPQVFMHRDFHSRNLMHFNNTIAVIDFQDAVCGPITYDIVSLLRDCYLKWPAEQVQALFEQYLKTLYAMADTLPFELVHYPQTQWQRWFDLMGVQRHIKASGIFARLFHRDSKSGYLADIPLTLSYIVDVCAKYPELSFLKQLVGDKIIPAVLNKTNKTESK